MNKKLIPHKDTFFNKIIIFFRKLFNKNTTEKANTQKNKDQNLNQLTKGQSKFEQTIKVDLKKVDLKNMSLEQFIDNLEKHPEWIKSISIDRLLKLKDYINKELKEYRKKIDNLKRVS